MPRRESLGATGSRTAYLWGDSEYSRLRQHSRISATTSSLLAAGGLRAAVQRPSGPRQLRRIGGTRLGYKPRATQEGGAWQKRSKGCPSSRGRSTGRRARWCAARELTRIAAPETEGAWIDTARGKTIRQLEEFAATKSPGDEPEAPATHLPRSRMPRSEVVARDVCAFRDAMRELEQSAGGRLDDSAALLTMARHVPAGSSGEGRASYRVSLTVCAACGRVERLRVGRARVGRGGGRSAPGRRSLIATAQWPDRSLESSVSAAVERHSNSR
jgi:hypothetical protein